MITRQDITNIFSEAYTKAALAENCDMRQAADLFESVRVQLDISEPYSSWDFILLDRVKFDNDYSLDLLIDLKESYFNLLFEKLLTNLESVYKNDKKEALRLWDRHYADAAVYYRDDMVCMLCHKRQQWELKDGQAGKYSKLPAYIRENRWPEAFSYYVEIAANKDLSDKVRAYSEITLMEIILYYYPEYSRALSHLDSARALLPDHFITKRAEAVYYLKTGEIQKARNGFLQVIALKPGDFVSFDFIGDCFFTEAMKESAESWYTEAIQKNFLQTDSYKRLLNLYGDITWFKEKEPLMDNLLQKIEKRQGCRNTAPLISKNLATNDCFINFSLYESYRNVAAAWSAAQDFKKAEEWYGKAVELQPGIVSAILDLAYVKLDRKLPEKALEFFFQALEIDNNYFEIYWGLAFYYEDHGQKEEALRNFNECLRLRPEWSDWINNFIGNLYFSLKEYKESETYYRKAVELNGNYLIYRQNLAGALEAQADQLVEASKQSEAEELYLSAVAIDNDADRWNTAGNFYYKLKRWKEAADCYDKALELRGNDAILHENRGLAYENMLEYDEAEKSYKKALEMDRESGRFYNRLGVFNFERKKYDEAVGYYQQALDREPKDTTYLENICLAYEQMNLQDEAEPYYLRLLEIEPANDEVLNLLGNLYYKRTNYEKALEFYTNAIAHNAANVVYYENLSALHRDQGHYPEAIDFLKKALEIKPENDVNWNNTGVLYFYLADYDKALEYYFKALELKPGVSLYNENIAAAYDMKQQTDKAVHYYNLALQINPKNAKALNAIGLIYFNRKQYEPAIANYRQAVALEKNNGIFQTNLGLALMLSGQKEEAMQVFQKAVKLKDDYYLSWNDLGVLYYEKGNLEQAIKCYNKSIRLQPDDPVLYSNLALALNAQGKAKEALEVTLHPHLKDEVRNQVEIMLHENLPFLFEAKS